VREILANNFKPNSLDTNEEQKAGYIIFRANHTVSMIREGDDFLLMDSYNNFGAIEDNTDDLPLLEIVRRANKNANIFVFNDKAQNDYHNCSVFSVNSLAIIFHTLQEQNVSLAQYIKKIDTEKWNADEPDKAFAYSKLGVQTIPIPAELCPQIQSIRGLKKATKHSESFDAEKVKLHTCVMFGRKQNRYIADIHEDFANYVKKGLTWISKSGIILPTAKEVYTSGLLKGEENGVVS
jgi:hypothetical protein